MIAADSGVRVFGEGVPHPRGYGNSARVLVRYVRELQVLRLEDAVRRMTSLPTTTFRLKDRGTLWCKTTYPLERDPAGHCVINQITDKSAG